MDKRNLIRKESWKQGTSAEPRGTSEVFFIRNRCTFPSSALPFTAQSTFDHNFSALLFLVRPCTYMENIDRLLAYNTIM